MERLVQDAKRVLDLRILSFCLSFSDSQDGLMLEALCLRWRKRPQMTVMALLSHVNSRLRMRKADKID